jgi:hypothetical protein
MMIREKKTVRQTVWLNDEQLQILKRLAARYSLKRAEIMRLALLDFARTKGVFATAKRTGGRTAR